VVVQPTTTFKVPKVGNAGTFVNVPRANGGANLNSRVATALKTAEAISKDTKHPNQAVVADLLNTYSRGWVDGNKFIELLRPLVV
jgi:hypothetical protein